MRFREDKPADLERAHVAVAEWRAQNPDGTDDQLIAALGPQFHRDYRPVLRAVLFTLDRAMPYQAGHYLKTVAVILTIEGIPCRLTPEDRPPILTIEEPGGAPNPVTIVIDPGHGPGFRIDCTCTWTPPAGTTADTTAGTVMAVLNALRPGPAPQPPM